MIKDYSYIRLHPEQATTLRKTILTLEMDLLQLIQRIINYKALRKSENQYRVMLRRTLEEASKEIRDIFSNIPQVHEKIKPKQKPAEKIKHSKEKAGKKIKSIKKTEKSGRIDVKDRLKEIREREEIARKQKDKAKSNIEDKLNEIKKRLAGLGAGNT